MKLAILNTSIVAAYGSFSYKQITLEDAKHLLHIAQDPMQELDGFQSHVGHESTAQLLSSLLEEKIPMDRTPLAQEIQQPALVFKLKGRAPEGKILSIEEIEAIGYEFGLLTRLS